MKDRREKFRDNMPESYRKNYERAIGLSGYKPSKSQAVKAKCLDCCCWVRAEIRDCTVYTCPLYPHRPFK